MICHICNNYTYIRYVYIYIYIYSDNHSGDGLLCAFTMLLSINVCKCSAIVIQVPIRTVYSVDFYLLRMYL